jgi:hypothetical protein
MPISTEVSLITNADLTTKTVNGDGTFDVIMSSVAAHLVKEYEKGRITGQEYTKAYIELTTAALGAAVQFLLQKDNAYWTGVKIEQDAKVIEYNLQYILPLQKALTENQVALTESQIEGADKDNLIKDYNLTELMPAQKELLLEQIEVQRAQTLDTRTDGITITGSVGKQKDLYAQQITSYQRDGEVKAAKLFTDAWITQKTIDEGLTAPAGFTNTSLDTILSKLKTNNGLT